MFSCLENLVHCPHHMIHFTEITFRGSSKLKSYNKYFAVTLAIVLSQVFLMSKVSDQHNCSGIYYCYTEINIV